jgi:purine-binding chemotaxis protein CheW
VPSSSTPGSGALSATEGKKDSFQFVGFQIGDQEYAFPIEQIQEIVILERITKTPQVPIYCEGVSNLRGSIIPIINLRALFGMEPKLADSETRTIVVKVHDRTMGCTVDTVSQVIRISKDNIQTAPKTVTADGAEYIVGFAKIDGRLVILLNINRLLDVEQLTQLDPVVAEELRGNPSVHRRCRLQASEVRENNRDR